MQTAMNRTLGYLRAALAGAAILGACQSAAARSADGTEGVVNGDFETGNTAFSSEYAPTTFLCGGNTGSYLLAANPSNVNCYGDWANIGDHTTGSGLMMIIDGSTVADTVIWSETVKVTPRKKYTLTFWGTGVNTNGGVTTFVQAYINGKMVGSPLNLPAYDGGWHEGTVSWRAGRATTQATILLIDTQLSGGWNDFALDDIALTRN